MSGLTQGTRVGRLEVEYKRDVLALGQAQERGVAPQTKNFKGWFVD